MKKNFLTAILTFALLNIAGLTFAADDYHFTVSDKTGKIILNENLSKDTIFMPAYNPQNLVIKKYVNRKEQAKIINSNGKYLFNNAYDHVNPLTSKIYLAEKNKTKYILNENGARMLTPNSSAMVEAINENAFSIKEFNSKSSGSGSVKDNFMAKHQSIIYNNNMKKIYNGDMTYTQNINPGYIFVKIDNENGKIIDSEGNTIINGVKYCENFKPGIIYAKTLAKEGIYDVRKHAWVYDKTIQGIPEIGADYAILPVVKNGETFRILTDKNFKPYKAQDTYYYIIPANDVFLASTNGMTTNKVLNAKSKVIYSAKSGENIENAGLKNVVIEKNNKYALKTIKGKEILPAKYDNINISANSILTQNGNNFEILNAKYKTVSKFVADSAALRNNIIFAKSNEGYKLINATTGKTAFSSDDIKEYSVENSHGKIDYLFTVSQNGKKGMVNSQNSTVVPFEYDDISPLNLTTADTEELVFALKKGEKYAITVPKTYTPGSFVYSFQPVQTFTGFTVLKK